MKTLLQYTYSIKEKLASFNLSADMDTLLDNELIVGLINDVNIGLIQEAYRNNMITPDLYTPSCCNELQCASESECVIAGIPVSSTNIIHYVEIDNLVPNIPLDVSIRYIGLSNYQTPIKITRNLTEFATWEYRGASKHMPVGYLIGNRLYVKNSQYFTSSVTFLCMLALVSKPQDMCNYNEDTTIYNTPNPQKLEYLVFQQCAIALGLRGGDDVNNTNPDNDGQQGKAVQQQQQ